MYSQSAGSLRIRFRGSLVLLVVVAETDGAAGDDGDSRDSCNGGIGIDSNDDDDEVEEDAVVVFSASA